MGSDSSGSFRFATQPRPVRTRVGATATPLHHISPSASPRWLMTRTTVSAPRLSTSTALHTGAAGTGSRSVAMHAAQDAATQTVAAWSRLVAIGVIHEDI